MLKMKPTVKKYWQQWEEVEKQLVVCMLYHSGSVSDAAKYAELSKEIITAPPKIQKEQSNEPTNVDETQYLIESFSVIGRHINVVLNWMMNRLQGQSDF